MNSALRGPRVPSWPVLAKVVAALGGDEGEFQELWAATRDHGIKSEPLPIPAADQAVEVSVFASYSHIDNDATYERISKIILGIKGIYESLTGSKVEIFKDADSIALGENWRDRIRMGLSSSSILLAFVSPAYLRSESCRQEFREFLGFLEANSKKRLIIPLLYADFDRIEARFARDELWQEIKSLQVLKLEAMRSLDPGSAEWIRALEMIAYRIEEVLSSVETEEPGDDSGYEAGEAQEFGQGLLELFAEIEETTPRFALEFERFNELINQLGEETQSRASRLAKASTFSSKLAVSKQLAEAINPIAVEAYEISERLLAIMAKWDSGVRYGIELIASKRLDIDEEDASQFIEAIGGLAETGNESLSHLETLRHTIASARGISGQLNKPLARIQQALLRFAEMAGIFQGWGNELKVLGYSRGYGM
ncbi:toll/interleukin-1 receptor domain-containing protein [Sphaerisporangium sp. NPDC051017]|uniref:toll/interleukin-1 receptor domain-containing protein n=1 Tax=Sphaerisporangium sp. NPDC051017 TaxID=3154636 RepID=UPI003424B9EF